MTTSVLPPTLSDVAEMASRVRENVGKVIVGREQVLDYTLAAILSEGHILLDDVPGLGKTMLAKSFARSIGCSFRRIQFTPDLLPSDVTGVNIYNQKSGEFEFRAGPLLAQLVLADEINRASPRTQAALLEAMEERQLTVEGETMAMPRPFLVIATQNPVELEGTFPLPEAQLDRFLLRLRMGYPDAAEEDAILLRFERAQPLEELDPVVESEQLRLMVKTVEQVRVSEAGARLHRGDRAGLARGAGVRAWRVAARFAGAAAHDARAGGDSRPRLCPARRCAGDGARRVASPVDAVG